MHPDLINNVIIFNHIPKAGGTSLTDLFRKIYGPDKCFRHRARSGKDDKYSVAIGALEKRQLNQFLFLSGHFDFGNHTRFQKPVKYISVVRDPIDRVISDYYFNQQRGRKDRQDLTAEKSLNEYIQLKLDNPKSRLVHSYQVQYVTGQSDPTLASDIIDSHYLLCCSTRQLNDMQRLIAKLAGREDLGPQMRNTLKKSDDQRRIDPALEKTLLKNFEADYALFDIVEKKFEAQLQAFGGLETAA